MKTIKLFLFVYFLEIANNWTRKEEIYIRLVILKSANKQREKQRSHFEEVYQTIWSFKYTTRRLRRVYQKAESKEWPSLRVRDFIDENEDKIKVIEEHRYHQDRENENGDSPRRRFISCDRQQVVLAQTTRCRYPRHACLHGLLHHHNNKQWKGERFV